MFLVVSGVLLVALLVWASEVLLPFVLAILIAYVFTPLVTLCERIRIPRGASILVVYLVTFTVIYASVAATAPRMMAEIRNLARDTPGMLRDASHTWGERVEGWMSGIVGHDPAADSADKPEATFDVLKRDDGGYSVRLREPVDIVQEGPNRWRIVPNGPVPAGFDVTRLIEQSTARFIEYVRRNAVELIKVGRALVAGTARGIFMLFMTLMVAGYLMLTRESILEFVKSLLPRRQRPEFDRLLWRLDRGFSGVIRGQLLICLVNGLLSALGFWLFGLKYWPVLAAVAAVLSIIPIFGAILSSVPAVMIGLTQSFWTALSVLGWIVVVHQIEANVLNPKIIGASAKIHPVLVVFSLVLGEHMYGLWGALLAVPCLSLVQGVFNHFRFQSMPDVAPDSTYHQARISHPPPAP